MISLIEAAIIYCTIERTVNIQRGRMIFNEVIKLPFRLE